MRNPLFDRSNHQVPDTFHLTQKLVSLRQGWIQPNGLFIILSGVMEAREKPKDLHDSEDGENVRATQKKGDQQTVPRFT
jgi:hypothetical protein